jgi:shikimate kinase
MIGRGNIYLIGPMGSGKTAVGRALAQMLDRPFFDSDAEIERRTGVDIRFIFEKEGEARFRAREREILAEVTQLQGIVLATGGGAVLDPESRRQLAETGVVVYLKVALDQQWQRTRRNRHRPLLLDPNPRAVLERLNELRGPLYAEIADLTIETGGHRIKTVAGRIREFLETQAAAPLACATPACDS